MVAHTQTRCLQGGLKLTLAPVYSRVQGLALSWTCIIITLAILCLMKACPEEEEVSSWLGGE